MKTTFLFLSILAFGMALQDQGCGGGGGGGQQCQTPFYPPYDVRTRFDGIRGGVIVEWSDRGYKDGYQVFRCANNNCIYQGSDGLWYANLNNFQPITNNKFAGSSLLDKNVSRGVTYYYAVQNRYQSCGVNWSSNFATITTP